MKSFEWWNKKSYITDINIISGFLMRCQKSDVDIFTTQIFRKASLKKITVGIRLKKLKKKSIRNPVLIFSFFYQDRLIFWLSAKTMKLFQRKIVILRCIFSDIRLLFMNPQQSKIKKIGQFSHFFSSFFRYRLTHLTQIFKNKSNVNSTYLLWHSYN